MLLRVLRLAAAWAFTALFWLVWALPALLRGSLRLSPERAQAALRLWGRGAARILGIEIVCENESTLEAPGPRVIVFNHQSALDMLWVAWTAPPAPLALGKKEISWVPFVNLAWWMLDFRLVDRHNPRIAAASLRVVPQEVAAGRSLLIAPEGTRTRDGSFLPFKKGGFVMALRAGAPIYPVVTSGAFEAMGRTEWVPHPGTIRVRFLPPVPTAGLPETAVDELQERVRASMVEAYERMRTEGPATR